MDVSPARDSILTISQITALIKNCLAESFPAVWVKGELTGVRHYGSSGHLYFSLKDGGALIQGIMYKSRNQRLAFEAKDGLQVEAFGAVSVYESRGQYQLIVDEMRLAGMGARLVALEALKRKLDAEGLFSIARKRSLPAYPQRIGLVTSPEGAAVRDLVKVLRQRWPSIALVLAPVRVQGPGAAEEIAAAIRRFGRYGGVEVLIVGRGGGSIEDLWAFNEEMVARAIAASTIPVISAVGHEVDTTLADLVADVRAATPSNAAEIAVQVRGEIAGRVRRQRLLLDEAIRRLLLDRRRRLHHATEKYAFKRQGEVFDLQRRKLDDSLERMRDALLRRLRAIRERIVRADRSYGLRELPRAIAARRVGIEATRDRLERAAVQSMLGLRTRLAGYDHRLHALSPRQVLERGYCLARRPDGTLLRSADGLAVGDPMRVEFARGEADARIEAVRPGGSNG